MSDIAKLSTQTAILQLDTPKGIALKDQKNVGSLNHKNLDPKAADEKVREVANEYEKYFMKEMMRHMRSTVQESDFMKANHAEKIFQEQLDDQYSTEWNKRGGFGISDMIYQQLTEKFGPQLGLKSKDDAPKGPLPLDRKIHIKEMKTDKDVSLMLTPEKTDEGLIAVQNPWAGTLQNKKSMEGDKTSYEIKHDNGLESLILTQGAPSEQTRHLSPGDKIESGQSLGLAQSSSPLVWTVKSSVSE